MNGDNPVQIVAETLLDLLPSVYGHRMHDEHANIEDTPLGRDADVIVQALHAADFLAAPNLTARAALLHAGLFSARYDRDRLSTALREMARRVGRERRRWHDAAEALGYGRGGDPVFIAERMRLAGQAYQHTRQVEYDTLRSRILEAQGGRPGAEGRGPW